MVTDPASGRASLHLLPRFETISYGELWSRIQAIAADWHHHDQYPLRPGDFVCVLGFASIDYTAAKLACVHLGAVVVPLQTSAPAAQHAPILSETQPRILAVGIDYLATAVEAALDGAAPQRLMVFDYEPRDDSQRAAYDAACARLADSGSSLTVQIITELVERERRCHPRRCSPPGRARTRWRGCSTPPVPPDAKGRDVHRKPVHRNLARAVRSAGYHLELHADEPPDQRRLRDHDAGQWWTSYFAGKSDLSTLFDDLAMARPTTLSLVPRVCEMFFHQYLSELDRRTIAGAEPDQAGDEITTAMRNSCSAVGCWPWDAGRPRYRRRSRTSWK